MAVRRRIASINSRDDPPRECDERIDPVVIETTLRTAATGCRYSPGTPLPILS